MNLSLLAMYIDEKHQDLLEHIFLAIHSYQVIYVQMLAFMYLNYSSLNSLDHGNFWSGVLMVMDMLIAFLLNCVNCFMKF